jgi:hypothetical protein
MYTRTKFGEVAMCGSWANGDIVHGCTMYPTRLGILPVNKEARNMLQYVGGTTIK